MWRVRQRKLGIDDFGNPLEPSSATSEQTVLPDSPIPVTQGSPDGLPVQAAVSEAVQTDVRSEVSDSAQRGDVHEETPLLKKDDAKDSGRTWFSWLVPKRR